LTSSSDARLRLDNAATVSLDRLCPAGRIQRSQTRITAVAGSPKE
jgi:hypothetical protein